MRRKSDIESAGVAGLRVSFQDVARISRSVPTLIQLRHSWPESVDGRVWAAVHNAFSRGAQMQADALGRGVEVYNYQGNIIAAFEPAK